MTCEPEMQTWPRATPPKMIKMIKLDMFHLLTQGYVDGRWSPQPSNPAKLLAGCNFMRSMMIHGTGIFMPTFTIQIKSTIYY